MTHPGAPSAGDGRRLRRAPVDLPARSRRGDATRPGASRPVAPSSGPGSVLVVDDDLSIRRLVTELIEMETDLRVTAVADGYHAIQYLAKAQPDLMLLDLRMPVVDGLAVLRWMRAHPAPRRIPVVAFTAAGLPGIAQLMSLGCDDALMKPFDLADLLALVREHLPALT